MNAAAQWVWPGQATAPGFQPMFEGAELGVARCTLDGCIVESNPFLERMLGYSREELQGLSLRDFTHADDGEGQKLFGEMAGGKRDGYQVENRYVRKDGKGGWARSVVWRVPDSQGEQRFALLLMEDVTDRVRAEQRLQESERMEAVGRLVGGVAHDFNNLLTGILLYCDLLRLGLEPGSRLYQHSEEIRAAGEQAAALVQQLLAVGRQQLTEPCVLSLNRVAGGMHNLMRRLIGENIELAMELDDDLGRVKMDPAQAQQILLNLVLNARDALPDGGRIRVTTQNQVSSLHPEQPDEAAVPCVSLAVSDNGRGMDPETRARVFEPFFTTKKPGKGSGLGMATVHSIVKANGGVIAVDSELGYGTTVEILLPQILSEEESLLLR